MKILTSKKTLQAIMLCVIAGIGLFFLQTNLLTKTKGAHIVFAGRMHDFGKVAQGKMLKHAFTFINEGNQNLKIGKIKTSCGCTAATIGEETEYKPGEKGEITVTYSTEGRNGKKRQSIIVYTNDPQNNPVYLKIACDIIEDK